MTIFDKARRELARAERDVSKHKDAIDMAGKKAAHTAANDSGMMPGVGLAHAAVEIAGLAAKLAAANERVELLRYLLQEDEDAGIFG